MMDILNPIESEAETAIIGWLLEKRERASSKGETTGASIPLHMTDEAVASWQALAHVAVAAVPEETLLLSDTMKVATGATPPQPPSAAQNKINAITAKS
jgi:hypothetical protein